MKLSTFGIGIACFLVVLGASARFFSEGMPDRRTAAPEYLVRGQAPAAAPLPAPAKLTRGAIPKANPLRSGNAGRPINSSGAASIQPVSELRSDAAQTGYSVTPASNRAAAPKNDDTASRRSANFDAVPDSFGSPQDNFLESAGFPENPTAFPAFSPTEPQPLSNGLAHADTPQTSFAFPQTLETGPLSETEPNTLGQADPFAVGAPAAALPPRNHSAGATQRTAPPEAPFTVSADPTPALQSRAESEGTGTPGPAVLEGTQTPHLTLEKVLPAEIVLNRPATIKTVLRNVGRSTIRDITILDHIPRGTRLLSTSPEANVAENGELRWALGHLDGNEQRIVEMRVLPLREGEIGSIASVNYTAEVSARIAVTRPMLQVDVKAPREIRLGQNADLEITISNPGSATATGIVLEEYVPDGLYHKDGKVLVNNNVDSLKPGEAKKLTLSLACTGSGVLVNRLLVKADGDLKVEKKTTIQALSPTLNLEITGPKQRFLERKSGYRLVVSNSGNAAAQNVDLVLTLPPAVQFVSTNQSGVYEPSTHTVHWALEDLPAREAGEIELVLLPKKTGEHRLRFTGNGQDNLKAETTHSISIDGLSAISFDVVGSSHLVEIGKETVYEIRVANKGTKGSDNVCVQATLSDGMTFVRAEGPARHQTRNGVVRFEPLPRLEAKGDKVYKVAVKCLSDGDHRIRVQVVSDELRTPITKEESVRVFQ